MSYLRDRTRPQNDRSIFIKQDSFAGGLNVDVPATDLVDNECAGLENYIAYEKYLEGRTGSVEITDLDEEGEETSKGLFAKPLYHKRQKCLIYVAGITNNDYGYLYRQSGSTKVKFVDFDDNEITVGTGCVIKEFGENALLCDSTKIYFLYIQDDYAKAILFNQSVAANKPLLPLGADESGIYNYKYVLTYSFIIDTTTGEPLASGNRFSANAKVLVETPPILSFDYYTDYGGPYAIGEWNGFDYFNINMLAIDQRPNSSWFATFYRTPDLGVNGLNNPNYDQFAWIGDTNTLNIDNFLQLNDATLSIDILNRLKETTYRLSTVGFDRLNGSGNYSDRTSLLEVTDAFIFTANFNETKLFYSQRASFDYSAGYHHPGFQVHDYKEPLKIITGTNDFLIAICERSTHTISLNTFIDSGVQESVFVLNQNSEIDSEIGILKIGTFATMSNGSFIAVCSDNSVRVGDSTGWGKDLANDKVRRLIEKNNENNFKVGVGTSLSRRKPSSSCAIFYNGAYYLWFNKFETFDGGEDVGDDAIGFYVPDFCLRLSVTRESGRGWTQYSGNEWIMPYGENGVFVADDFTKQYGIGHEFLFAIDRVDKKFYWIDTFEGFNGATIGPNNFPVSKYFTDKYNSEDVGTDILCRVKGPEMTGSRESFVSIHQESHAYCRDLVDAELNDLTGYPAITYATLKIDARAYINGKLVSTETAGQVDPGQDISFGFRIEGDRIAIEFEANRSGHQITAIDHRLRVQDKKRYSRGVSASVARSIQSELQGNLNIWVATRPNPYLEQTGINQLRKRGISEVLAPDGRTNTLSVQTTNSTGSLIVKQNTTVFNAFTYSGWIKTPTLLNGAKSVLFKVNGSTPLTVTLDGSNVISSVEFGGSVSVEDPNTATNNVEGWSHFAFVRLENASTMQVFQNDVLKGSLPVNTSFGGGNIEIGGVV